MSSRLNRESVRWCLSSLGAEETRDIVRMARGTEGLRQRWIRKWRKILSLLDSIVAQSLAQTGQLPSDDQILAHIEQFMVDHLNGVITKGNEDVRAGTRLARRSLSDLQKLWDKLRAGKLPKRQRDLASKIKTAYLRRCRSVWEKYSGEFRTGEQFNQAKVVKIIQKASDGVYARGKMIVETETTRYYNQTRVSIYDQSPDVTHYLFLAIMDVATTKWCKSRHRVVYRKGESVTSRETPPVHWNCRSEMVPLTPANPRHKLLIDNKSMWRINRRPEPLPVGWNT